MFSVFIQTTAIYCLLNGSVMLQISTSVQQGATIVTLMPRVLTSKVASRVAALAVMTETVKLAQV